VALICTVNANPNPNPNPDPNPIPNPNPNPNLHPVLQIRAIFTHKGLTNGAS